MSKLQDDSAETQCLIKQIRSGETGAIDKLFARYRTYLHQVIEMRMDDRLRQRVDASDVVQETQLEAARLLSTYLERESVPFRLWLRQIARNRLHKIRRRHIDAARRTTTREVSLPERSTLQFAEQLLARGSTPSQHVSKQELVRRVQKGLSQLSDFDREILLMRNYEELSYEEIGYVMEIEPAAAKMRHGRALLRLTKTLSNNGLTESQL